MISKCNCGWQGLTDTMMVKNTPMCPNCNKVFSQFRCEGCGE